MIPHDPQTINTVMKEFDAVIELRETDVGDRELRIRGVLDVAGGWVTF